MLWFEEKGMNVALFKLFAEHLWSVATAKIGKIRIGAYITILAKFLNLLGPEDKWFDSLPIKPQDKLNLDTWACNFTVRKFIINGVAQWREVDKQGKTIWFRTDTLNSNDK